MIGSEAYLLNALGLHVYRSLRVQVDSIANGLLLTMWQTTCSSSGGAKIVLSRACQLKAHQ